MRTIQGELKMRISEPKEKQEEAGVDLQQNNLREVCSGMRTITGFRTNDNRGVKGSVDRANELNLF